MFSNIQYLFFLLSVDSFRINNDWTNLCRKYQNYKNVNIKTLSIYFIKYPKGIHKEDPTYTAILATFLEHWNNQQLFGGVEKLLFIVFPVSSFDGSTFNTVSRRSIVTHWEDIIRWRHKQLWDINRIPSNKKIYYMTWKLQREERLLFFRQIIQKHIII